MNVNGLRLLGWAGAAAAGRANSPDCIYRWANGSWPRKLRRSRLPGICDARAWIAGQSQIHYLDLGNASGGHFNLGNNLNLVELAFDATANDIQTALETLYGPGNVAVEGSPGESMLITFHPSVGVSGLEFSDIDLEGAGLPALTEIQEYKPAGPTPGSGYSYEYFVFDSLGGTTFEIFFAPTGQNSWSYETIFNGDTIGRGAGIRHK